MSLRDLLYIHVRTYAVPLKDRARGLASLVPRPPRYTYTRDLCFSMSRGSKVVRIINAYSGEGLGTRLTACHMPARCSAATPI